MGLLGRLAGLGRSLITRGLAGIGGNAPPVVVTPRVGVCIDRPIAAGPLIFRRVGAPVVVTLAAAETLTVARRVPSVVSVRRPVPEC